jgi:DNA-binding beta-propeller fold protein YncE
VRLKFKNYFSVRHLRGLRAGNIFLFLVIWLGVSPLANAAETKAPPAWPPPPAEPRIVFVREILEPRDIGVRPPALLRFANWITGVSNSRQKLDRPFGLALDDAENLLVADTGTATVSYLDLAHKKWRNWSTVGDIRLLSPVAAVRRGPTFFVADSCLGEVIAFDEKSKVQFVITNELERPSGLALLGDQLLIADSQRHQIVVCDLRGKMISKFGRRGKGLGEFNFPTHVSVDNQRHIYVTDSLNCRIQVFDADGHFLSAFGSAGDGPGRFSRPKGVAADRDGHVYVVDGVFNNVQIFDDQNRLLLDFGEPGAAAGQFCLPNAIVINSKNEIFVADAFNHRLQEFRYLSQP